MAALSRYESNLRIIGLPAILLSVFSCRFNGAIKNPKNHVLFNIDILVEWNEKGENMSHNALTTVGENSNKGLTILGMSINSLTEAMEVAEFFAKSDLVPKDYKNKPGNIVVAWQKGFEVGLLPQQSLETIAVINGRASIWGDGLIALVKSSPLEEWTNEWIEGEGEKMVAYCETKRKNQTKTIKQSFSVDDAKKSWSLGQSRIVAMSFCEPRS